MKDNEWNRNGKGDKPRTKTWERKWQDNYDEIDWSENRKKKKHSDCKKTRIKY